jgi:hypothetical protein
MNEHSPSGRPSGLPSALADGSADDPRMALADPAAAPSLGLQIAVIDAAARIVAGPQSSHLIQDPDIAQGVAASFRTVYDAIMQAVSAPRGG